MLYQTKNPHGGDIYDGDIRLDFSANTNPFGTPPAVAAAMQEALGQIHRYPDPYCRRLVQKIADFEGLPKEYILCGNGAAEVIYSYCETVKAARAVELAPTFSEYSLGLERTGCSVERYLLHKENDFRLEEGFLDYLQEEHPDVVFLCNPNNPTGITVPPKLMRNILDLCQKQSMRIFVDECFLDLTDRRDSLRCFLKEHPQLFLLKAFTKSYGMAGIRLGYGLCSDAEFLASMSKTVQPWNVSGLAQAAGVAALGEREFLQRARTVISEERRWMKQQLEQLGFWVCPSETNYLLFYGPEGLCDALRNWGIAIRNCDNYHGLEGGWYRTAVRFHEENKALIDALQRIVRKA